MNIIVVILQFILSILLFPILVVIVVTGVKVGMAAIFGLPRLLLLACVESGIAILGLFLFVGGGISVFVAAGLAVLLELAALLALLYQRQRLNVVLGYFAVSWLLVPPVLWAMVRFIAPHIGAL